MPKVSGKAKAGPGKTTVQTLIFPKSKFKTAAAAKAWAKAHGRKSGSVEETGTSFRIRQFNPGDFQKGSFRTIDLGGGVKAVIGRPKRTTKRKSDLTVADVAAGILKPKQGVGRAPRIKRIPIPGMEQFAAAALKAASRTLKGKP